MTFTRFSVTALLVLFIAPFLAHAAQIGLLSVFHAGVTTVGTCDPPVSSNMTGSELDEYLSTLLPGCATRVSMRTYMQLLIPQGFGVLRFCTANSALNCLTIKTESEAFWEKERTTRLEYARKINLGLTGYAGCRRVKRIVGASCDNSEYYNKIRQQTSPDNPDALLLDSGSDGSCSSSFWCLGISPKWAVFIDSTSGSDYAESHLLRPIPRIATEMVIDSRLGNVRVAINDDTHTVKGTLGSLTVEGVFLTERPVGFTRSITDNGEGKSPTIDECKRPPVTCEDRCWYNADDLSRIVEMVKPELAPVQISSSDDSKFDKQFDTTCILNDGDGPPVEHLKTQGEGYVDTSGHFTTVMISMDQSDIIIVKEDLPLGNLNCVGTMSRGYLSGTCLKNSRVSTTKSVILKCLSTGVEGKTVLSFDGQESDFSILTDFCCDLAFIADSTEHKIKLEQCTATYNASLPETININYPEPDDQGDDGDSTAETGLFAGLGVLGIAGLGGLACGGMVLGLLCIGIIVVTSVIGAVSVVVVIVFVVKIRRKFRRGRR